MQPQRSNDLIHNHFTLAELQDLCHRLNVEYDNLSGGSTRTAKARALRQHLLQRGRLLALFELLQQERPLLDLAPCFHEIIAQNFGSFPADMDRLFTALGLTLRDFQERERHAWGSAIWVSDKAEKLQIYFYQRDEWPRLLQTVAAQSRLPLSVETLTGLFAIPATGPPLPAKGNDAIDEMPPVKWLGQGRRWAVLVGVNHYEDWQNYGPLAVCVNDVKAIQQALIAGGYEPERIQLLTDEGPEQPTRGNILSTLQAVASATEPNDSLLFYYSGHGSAFGNTSYLVAKDGRFNVLGDTAVSVTRIKEIMNNAPARAKAIVLDACHSGAQIGKGAEPMSAEFIRRVFEEAEGMVILASCKQGEKSYEWRDKERSVFTKYLLAAMVGAADRDSKGFVSIQDAGRYVVDAVKLWASQRKVSQTPTLETKIVGDIILTYYEQPESAGN